MIYNFCSFTVLITKNIYIYIYFFFLVLPGKRKIKLSLCVSSFLLKLEQKKGTLDLNLFVIYLFVK